MRILVPTISYNSSKGESKRCPSHSDRIMRGRDNKPRGLRYGGSRYGSGPYDCREDHTWCAKSMNFVGDDVPCAIVPYEQASCNNDILVGNDHQRTRDEERTGGERQKRRLASSIVSPSPQSSLMAENVTIRTKSLARSLTYSPQA